MREDWQNHEIEMVALPDVEQLHFIGLERALLRQRLIWFIIFVLLLIGGLVVILLLPDIEIDWMVYGILSVGLLLFLGFMLISIFKNFAYQAYVVRERDIIYRKGWIVKTLKTLSFNRVQHTEVNQSAFDRWFGIARLSVFTAGGSFSDLSIPGLPKDVAYKINDFIIKKITPIRDEEE